MSDKKDPKSTHVSVDEWTSIWSEGRSPWHRDERNDDLVKHLDKMLDGRTGIRIFFPLCGKSVDMRWLYEEGHYIVGVEASTLAIKEFFDGNNIKYDCTPIQSLEGTLYKSDDDRIHIYACDMFKFNKNLESGFDAIFDRGAFEAINKSDRHRYTEIMQSIMNADCRYLLSTFEYDPNKYSGPPHFVPEQELIELFDLCKVEQVDYYENVGMEKDLFKLDSLHQRMHLLTLQ